MAGGTRKSDPGWSRAFTGFGGISSRSGARRVRGPNRAVRQQAGGIRPASIGKKIPQNPCKKTREPEKRIRAVTREREKGASFIGGAARRSERSRKRGLGGIKLASKQAREGDRRWVNAGRGVGGGFVECGCCQVWGWLVRMTNGGGRGWRWRRRWMGRQQWPAAEAT